MTDIEWIRENCGVSGHIAELQAENVHMDAAGYAELVRVALAISGHPGNNPMDALQALSDGSAAKAFFCQADGSLIWVAKVDGVTHYIQLPRNAWQYKTLETTGV